MAETQQTSIRFAKDVYVRLEVASALTGLPINSILVIATLEWLDTHHPERLAEPLPAHLQAMIPAPKQQQSD